MNKHLLALTPLATGLLLAFNVAAQDHSQHPTPMPARTQEQQKPTHDHSRHQPAPTTPTTPPPAEHDMDHGARGHRAAGQGGQESEREPADASDHEAMDHDMPMPGDVDHAAMGHAMPRPADQPVTPIPELTDADRAAAVPPPEDHPVHDDSFQSFVLLDRLEALEADEGRGMEWEARAWFGTDYNKLWLRSEGERIAGDTEDADLEVLYGRSVARWWDVVAGIRHHFEPGGSQELAVLGLTGMAPYKFEVDASLYLGDSGHTGVRLEVEYETLLTSRLILQPALEVEIHGQDDESHGNGEGLGLVEAGLRLRYEFTRRFAPYLGVVHERAFGGTADFRRAEGQDINDTRIVAGVRVWF
jgi:copper resistance protein B